MCGERQDSPGFAQHLPNYWDTLGGNVLRSIFRVSCEVNSGNARVGYQRLIHVVRTYLTPGELR